jgi:hypothetical protein
MDVMAAHDIKVMFHIEPYGGRNDRYADDIAWLVSEYGDKRGWDAMLLLRDAHGKVVPVFKSFRTIVTEQTTDCHGIVHDVADYMTDDEWNQRTTAVRERFRGTFDHVTLLADSLQVTHVAASGFDGSAPYDNFRDDTQYREQAVRATGKGLLFSFNCNPGFDGIARRNVPADSCYVPPPFHPDQAVFDWSLESKRERARRLAQRQIRDTLRTSIKVQLDPVLANYHRGFFLVFLNSFNEWHEGHQFEPAKKYQSLTEEGRTRRGVPQRTQRPCALPHAEAGAHRDRRQLTPTTDAPPGSEAHLGARRTTMAVSVFDLFTIGIGPSSSHTVGPMRAARDFGVLLRDQELLSRVARVQIELFGSLALTGPAHGTDRALLLGLEGDCPESVDIETVAPRVEAIREHASLNLAGARPISWEDPRDLIFRRNKRLPAQM